SAADRTQSVPGVAVSDSRTSRHVRADRRDRSHCRGTHRDPAVVAAPFRVRQPDRERNLRGHAFVPLHHAGGAVTGAPCERFSPEGHPAAWRRALHGGGGAARGAPRTPMTDAIVAPRAGRREWLGLAVLPLPCALYSVDLTVLNLALPRISADLRPTSAQLLWIVDIYGFALAGLLVTMGTLGDRIGRRRLLLIGAAAFGVGSVLAAFSRTAEMLIATRALLGIAGATLAPSTLSLVRNMFLDQQQRTTAIGVWVASYSLGAAIGPFVGGLLLESFWWGSVFLIGVPVMVLLLAFGPLVLPEFKDP